MSEEDEDEEDGSSSCSMDSNSVDICYVLGDVTHPHAAKGDAIIIHCVGKRCTHGNTPFCLSDFSDRHPPHVSLTP